MPIAFVYNVPLTTECTRWFDRNFELYKKTIPAKTEIVYTRR